MNRKLTEVMVVSNMLIILSIIGLANYVYNSSKLMLIFSGISLCLSAIASLYVVVMR